MPARVAVCTLLFACSSFATADDAEAKKAAKAQAQECQDALAKGDYAKLVARMPPDAVKAGGGAEKMAEVAAGAMQALKDKGVTIKSVKVHDPLDPVKAAGELYVIVPLTVEFTIPGGRAVAKGALVGVSTDGGKEWAFTDTAPGRADIKKVLPNLPEALVFPKQEPPTIVKE